MQRFPGGQHEGVCIPLSTHKRVNVMRRPHVETMCIRKADEAFFSPKGDNTRNASAVPGCAVIRDSEGGGRGSPMLFTDHHVEVNVPMAQLSA